MKVKAGAFPPWQALLVAKSYYFALQTIPHPIFFFSPVKVGQSSFPLIQMPSSVCKSDKGKPTSPPASGRSEFFPFLLSAEGRLPSKAEKVSCSFLEESLSSPLFYGLSELENTKGFPTFICRLLIFF